MPETVVRRRALLGALCGIGACTIGVSARVGVAAAGIRKHSRGALSRPEHIVAIDPGHGGADPGTISPDDVREKTITLATAVELARQLDDLPHYRPFLTRTRDVYVPLRKRVARARAHRADLFISIHADALPDAQLHGLSVYTLSSQASDRETAALARRENRDDFVSGLRLSHQPPEISNILLDLVRRQTNNRSLGIAQAVVAELGRTVALLEKPHRSADFAVLTAPDIPSVLVELGCLSNPREEHLLRQPVYRQRLAAGLVRAIEDYFWAWG